MSDLRKPFYVLGFIAAIIFLLAETAATALASPISGTLIDFLPTFAIFIVVFEVLTLLVDKMGAGGTNNKWVIWFAIFLLLFISLQIINIVTAFMLGQTYLPAPGFATNFVLDKIFDVVMAMVAAAVSLTPLLFFKNYS